MHLERALLWNLHQTLWQEDVIPVVASPVLWLSQLAREVAAEQQGRMQLMRPADGEACSWSSLSETKQSKMLLEWTEAGTILPVTTAWRPSGFDGCTQHLCSSVQPKLSVEPHCQRASSTGSRRSRCGTQPSTTLPWMRQATSLSKEPWRRCPRYELWAGAERAKLQPGRAPASPSTVSPVGWEVFSCSRAPFRHVWGRPGCSCPLAASCFLCVCQQRD